jgi:NADH dehydrogenase (ubiquinone) 1 alpha subcomplex subunit 5
MRPTVRLLARFLEPGAPTGLAGLYTHPAPRSTLIYLYSSILNKLQQVPAHSPYRQATEALTKKRLAIIEAAKPDGFDAWEERVRVQLSQHQKWLGDENKTSPDHLTYDGRSFVLARLYEAEVDEREKDAEWDGKDEGHTEEGPRTAEVRDKNLADMYRVDSTVLAELPKLDPEPLLTREQYVALPALCWRPID